MDRLLQVGQRFAIAATILLFVTTIVFLLKIPADKLAVLVIATADVGLMIAGVVMFHAYRNGRPIVWSLSLLLFTLIVAHLGGYLLLTRFEPLAWLQQFDLVQRLFQTKAT